MSFMNAMAGFFVGKSVRGGYDDSRTAQAIRDRNKIEKEKLVEIKLGNKIKQYQRYSDEELAKKLNNTPREVDCTYQSFIRGGAGNKILFQTDKLDTIEDNETYLDISDELNRRGSQA